MAESKKKKSEWFGMKSNEFISYAVAGTIVLLLVLDYLGVFNMFKKTEQYSFADNIGDTDPAVLGSIGPSLKNIEDSLVSDRPPGANLEADEISHLDMLKDIASELWIMGLEEFGTNMIETHLKKAVTNLTKLPMEDAMKLMDPDLVNSVMTDFADEFAGLPAKEVKEKAAKKAAQLLSDPSYISKLPDGATKSFLQKEVSKMGSDPSDAKALAKAAKKAANVLKASGSLAFPEVTGVIWKITMTTSKLSYQVPTTIGSMILRKMAGGTAVNIAARKAQAMAMKEAMKMQLKLIAKTVMKKGLASSAKMLMGMAIGPVGWALEIIGLIGTIFDMWDFNNEQERLDMEAYNNEVDYVEARASVLAQINAQPWPPIASVQRFFPEEFEQAMYDVYGLFQERAVDHILEYPDQDISLFAFVQKMIYGIPKRVYEEEVLKKIEGVTDTLDDQEKKFGALVMKMMENAPQMREVAKYNSLIRHITENCNRDFENAKSAPFWYFAMSIPTAYYTGTSDVEDIPVAKRGINYSNLTIHDIKISEVREEFGKTYIDIYRAKIPYKEERVRAYEIKEADIKDKLEDVFIPEMPNIAEIAENGTAEYKRYLKKGFMDNMIVQAVQKKFGAPTEQVEKKFGFRDEPASKIGGRARNNAHSNWLAMCCFQQFLIQLATHTGVNVDLGPEGALYNGDRVALIYGVFKWKDKYYRAFQPKPWHEPRFVSLDLSYISTPEGGVHLNEAAAHRWNEVYEHLRTAGSVVAQYRGIPADRQPAMPVAVWSKHYPRSSYVPGASGATPLATRVIKNFNNVNDIYKKNGRIHFRRSIESRLVKMMSLNDFDKINGNFRNKKQGWADAFSNQDIDPVPIPYDSAPNTLDKNKMYRLKLDSGLEVVFYNGNTTGINPWLRKVYPIIKNKKDVKSFPTIRKVKDYINTKLKHHIRQNPGGTMLKNDDEGVFEAEIMVDGYEELVWVNEIGKPDPKNYSSPSGIPHDIPEINKDYKNDLAVRIYSIEVRVDDEKSDDYGKKLKVHFVNHDGTVDPNWNPGTPGTDQLGRPRMMLFPINKIYQWCTKGMENDDSMALHAKIGQGWDAMYDDNDYANKKGIYEQYRVQTMSGVPHAAMDNGALTFNDYNEEERYGDNYVVHAWQTFDHDTRRCYIKNKDGAERYCKKYKGEWFRQTSSKIDHRDGKEMYLGKCYMKTWTVLFSFLVGENIIRMINRGKT